MRTALVVGLVGLSLAATMSQIESAWAQNGKGKSKSQPAAQMICNSAVGCRPVKPGCHIEPSNYVGQVEVCPGQRRPD